MTTRGRLGSGARRREAGRGAGSSSSLPQSRRRRSPESAVAAMPSTKKKAEVEKADQCLQAVVIAEAFDGAFRPVGAPKALMELCGRPVLEYTLRFLASAGAGEIFVLSSAHHVGAVRAFVEKRSGEGDWITARDGSPVAVRCLSMAGCSTAGDMLRELDQRGVVKSDPFLMCGGDVVARCDNMDAIIADHVERKKTKDADATLTILMAPGGDRFRRCAPLGGPDEDLVVCLDAASGRVLAWHASRSAGQAKLAFPVEALCKAQHAKIRADLVDCGVDVCSQEVLFRYSENFDYQDARRDFLHNEVANTELGQRAYARVLGPAEGFGVKVADPRALDFVARDLLCGWYAPELKPKGVEVTQACWRDPADGKPPRSTTVKAPVSLGAGCALGAGCVVRESTLGAGCALGDGAVVAGAHLGAGCVVGAGAALDQCLLAAGVEVGANARVAKGCVLGEGVVVGAGVHLPPFCRVTAKRPRDAAAAASDAALVGPDGVGRAFAEADDPPSDDDDDDFGGAAAGRDDYDSDDTDDSTKKTRCRDPTLGLMANAAAAEARETKWHAYPDDDDDDELTVDGGFDDGEAFGGGDDDFGDAAPAFAAPAGASDAAFMETVREMIKTGHKNGSAVDSMVMEINCYKLSENRSFRDAARPALEAVVDIAFAEGGGSKNAVLGALKAQLSRWQPLLAKVLGFGDVAEERHAASCLEALAPAEPGHARALLADPAVFAVVLQLLYGADILSGEGILAWGEAAAPELRAAAPVAQLLAFLEQSDSESDEDSD